MFIYTIYSFILLLIGLVGIFITRKNIIVILMCLELILLAINLNLVIYSLELDDVVGQMFALFVLTIAAAESSIGLAILLVYYRIKGSISTLFINNLKG